MEILSGLENTNVVGQIMVYNNIIMEELANKPRAVSHYLEIVRKFKGEVTKSAKNTNINLLYSHSCLSPPPSTKDPHPLPPWLCHESRDHKQDLF